jgi:hypothetical protein
LVLLFLRGETEKPALAGGVGIGPPDAARATAGR